MKWTSVDHLYKSLVENFEELEKKLGECSVPSKELLQERDQLGRGQPKKHLVYMKHFFTNKLTEMNLVANKMCHQLLVFFNEHQIEKQVNEAPCPQLDYKATHCGHTWGFLGHLNWTIKVISLLRRKLRKLGGDLEVVTPREFQKWMQNYYNRVLHLEKWIDIVNELICVYDIKSIFNTPAYKDEEEMTQQHWYSQIRKDIDKEMFHEEEERLVILSELGGGANLSGHSLNESPPRIV
jgi:hypothetical protein